MGLEGAADLLGKPDGGKRTVNLCEVVNGVMYVLSTSCQWPEIPKDCRL